MDIQLNVFQGGASLSAGIPVMPSATRCESLGDHPRATNVDCSTAGMMDAVTEPHI